VQIEISHECRFEHHKCPHCSCQSRVCCVVLAHVLVYKPLHGRSRLSALLLPCLTWGHTNQQNFSPSPTPFILNPAPGLAYTHLADAEGARRVLHHVRPREVPIQAGLAEGVAAGHGQRRRQHALAQPAAEVAQQAFVGAHLQQGGGEVMGEGRVKIGFHGGSRCPQGKARVQVGLGRLLTSDS
jgi:hypothetical protein